MSVGVQYRTNRSTPPLSNIALRWMVQELVQADCDVLFDFKRWNLPVDIVLSPPSPSQSSFQGSSRSGESSVGLNGQRSFGISAKL